MNKAVTFLLLTALLISCKKEDHNIIWERSFGPGNAYFVEATADSGILTCGTVSGKPCLVKFAVNMAVETDFRPEINGLFSSAWSDSASFIAAGSSNGKMLLTAISSEGHKIWDTTIIAGFYLDLTSLHYSGNGNFIAIGSASPDSSDNGASGLLFVKFDHTGLITEKKEITSPDFLSAANSAIDGSGNIYLAMALKSGVKKPKALVTKYNSDIQKLWETELYNNPDFNAACLDATVDGSGNVYVTGETEAQRTSGTLNTSFAASLTGSGGIRWKKYMENSNTGTSLTFDESGNLLMLNRNCFIFRKVNPDDGTETGIVRMYVGCDSYTTDAFGTDMNLWYDGNILASGSLGGNFYIALKSSQ